MARYIVELDDLDLLSLNVIIDRVNKAEKLIDMAFDLMEYEQRIQINELHGFLTHDVNCSVDTIRNIIKRAIRG